jgi:hypothetical protein
MPTAREHLAVAASHGKIYAIGGYASTGITGTVEEYDPDHEDVAFACQPANAALDSRQLPPLMARFMP